MRASLVAMALGFMLTVGLLSLGARMTNPPPKVPCPEPVPTLRDGEAPVSTP